MNGQDLYFLSAKTRYNDHAGVLYDYRQFAISTLQDPGTPTIVSPAVVTPTIFGASHTVETKSSVKSVEVTAENNIPDDEVISGSFEEYLTNAEMSGGIPTTTQSQDTYVYLHYSTDGSHVIPVSGTYATGLLKNDRIKGSEIVKDGIIASGEAFWQTDISNRIILCKGSNQDEVEALKFVGKVPHYGESSALLISATAKKTDAWDDDPEASFGSSATLLLKIKCGGKYFGWNDGWTTNEKTCYCKITNDGELCCIGTASINTKFYGKTGLIIPWSIPARWQAWDK